jgi:agmatinase
MATTDTLSLDRRPFWSGMMSDDLTAEVGLLGVPFDGAVCYRKGAAFAPARLRELSSYLSCSSEEGVPLRLRVRDYGDVEVSLDWNGFFQAVENRASDVLQHPLALFIGGDHSVSIPLMKAFAKGVDGPIGVLHFDAHPDLFDRYAGHAWSHACTARRALELPNLGFQHLVFVGLRSIANQEWEFLQANPAISHFTARDCYRQGIEAVTERVIESLRDVRALYVTLDIDGLDPSCAPGTGIPEAGGLTTRNLLELVRRVVKKLPVRAMDVVEVSPPLDASDITSFAALKVIYEAWGALQEKQGRP